MEVNTDTKLFIFLLNKKHKCSIGRGSELDESCIEILVDKFLKSLLFSRRQAVDGANWKLDTFKIDLKIVRAIESENFGLCFAEHICKFMIFGWYDR